MTSAIAPLHFEIADDHPCLPGHFPGRPVVPGVVVLDRVFAAIEAQAGFASARVRMPQVKFLQPLLPRQAARVELEAVPSADKLDEGTPRWRFKVLREADAALLASGEVQILADTDIDASEP
jgi:3-hydroxyacyl-[acyl-carrier-protein] dehydratase